VPKGLFFDKSHTWAFMERDGLVRIGIDDFLQHLTGTLTHIKLKETGEKVVKGEKILTIVQEGKQLEIHSPVTGTIKSLNTDLDVDSSLVNSSPYYDGWIYLIQPRNWLRETEFLLMNDRYREWLRGEFLRLKDFFANAVKSNPSVYEHIVLQDGGQITDNALADLGPEVWEDFQTNFIDAAR
jgi:glycine cleavage system H lipoate-binding protein